MHHCWCCLIWIAVCKGARELGSIAIYIEEIFFLNTSLPYKIKNTLSLTRLKTHFTLDISMFILYTKQQLKDITTVIWCMVYVPVRGMGTGMLYATWAYRKHAKGKLLWYIFSVRGMLSTSNNLKA